MGALTSSEIETIRWHAAKGVKPGTIAQWYGLKALEVRAILETAPSGAPAADEDQPHSAGTATAEPEETGHRPQGSGESGRPSHSASLTEALPASKPRAAIIIGQQQKRLASKIGDDGRPMRPYAIRPGFSAAPAKACQWIEGNPTPDDSCKCLAPSAPGVSYCPDHAARAYRVLPRSVAAVFPLVSPTA